MCHLCNNVSIHRFIMLTKPCVQPTVNQTDFNLHSFHNKTMKCLQTLHFKQNHEMFTNFTFQAKVFAAISFARSCLKYLLIPQHRNFSS